MSVISLLKADPQLREQPQAAEKALHRLLFPFGGAEFYFSPQETPLFLLDLSLPADNDTGVNFDLRLAYAMVALAREQGVKKIRLAARVAEGFAFADVLEKSGYAQLKTLPEIEFLDISSLPSASHATDTALVLDRADICEAVYQADIIVSLSKFKAAEDNLFGGALNNAVTAANLPDTLSFEEKQRAMVDIYSIVSPDLTVVDGTCGDSNFQPQPLDFLLAAADAVAADAVLAAIAGIDLSGVEYLQLAAQYGLGTGDPGGISLYGDDMGEIML